MSQSLSFQLSSVKQSGLWTQSNTTDERIKTLQGQQNKFPLTVEYFQVTAVINTYKLKPCSDLFFFSGKNERSFKKKCIPSVCECKTKFYRKSFAFCQTRQLDHQSVAHVEQAHYRPTCTILDVCAIFMTWLLSGSLQLLLNITPQSRCTVWVKRRRLTCEEALQSELQHI